VIFLKKATYQGINWH